MKERIKLAGQFLLILFLYALLTTHFSLLFAQETIIDTVYSIPELDGGIGYVINNGIYMVDNTYGGFYVGDWWGAIHGSVGYGRGFLAYPLPDIPGNYTLNCATLFVFQYFSVGNNEYWIYPIFNLETGDVEPPCLIEHINYGYSLDAGDFNLPALHPADTISTTPEQDWRSLEVTDWVEDDIENNRPYTQYRLRLSLDYDSDYLHDHLGFKSANASTEKPYMIYEYIQNNSIDDDIVTERLTPGLEVNAFPNPISTNATFRLISKENTYVDLTIYNIKGQKIKSIFSGDLERKEKEFNFSSGDLPNGIYFVKAISNKQIATKKILIIH